MEWNISIAQDGDHLSYWLVDPGNYHIRWHVGYHRKGEFGSVAGQVLEENGWYWFTSDDMGVLYSSMFGPFTSANAAMADCEVTHRQAK